MRTMYKYFPASIRGVFEQAGLELQKVQEIRMRAGQPLILLYSGKECTVGQDGSLSPERNQEFLVRIEDIRKTLEIMAEFSLYAYEDEIRKGFMTIRGGHRIGLAGRVIMNGSRIQSMREICSINIRFSREIPGCAKNLLAYITEKERLYHTLLISPPGCGKTTLLRDLIRMVSNGYDGFAGRTVGVVDERSELAGLWQGQPQHDVGIRTDVLDSCPKAEGMMMLLRSMSPRVIAVDELGASEDAAALENASRCGCTILATVHGNSLDDLRKKPVMRSVMEQQVFERYLILWCDEEKRHRVNVWDDYSLIEEGVLL